MALDIDGTTLGPGDVVADSVVAQTKRLAAAGHEVMFATGRSYETTRPVVDALGIIPTYLVCSNGAVTLRRVDDSFPAYERIQVQTFDPDTVLMRLHGAFGTVRFAVEDGAGRYRQTGPVTPTTIGSEVEQVEFRDLLGRDAARVVAMVPNHDPGSFRERVKQIDLGDVTYAFGWTAWIDVSAAGVTKARALDRVRLSLGISRDHVMAVGDGRNDIEMLNWAGELGRGVAMGHAPSTVLAAGSEQTGTIFEDGLGQVLATLN